MQQPPNVPVPVKGKIGGDITGMYAVISIRYCESHLVLCSIWIPKKQYWKMVMVKYKGTSTGGCYQKSFSCIL
jgi:hypothetical protein